MHRKQQGQVISEKLKVEMVNAWLFCSCSFDLASVVLGVTYNNIHELLAPNYSAGINKTNETRCVYSYTNEGGKREVEKGSKGFKSYKIGLRSLLFPILKELN